MATGMRVAFTTSDGVRLAGLHWDIGLRDLGCVVAHGFTGSSRVEHVQQICRTLNSHGAGVLAPDLRGHGSSGGRSTVGDLEIHDIAASVEWLRERGYQKIAILGWSMGGSAVLRFAGLGGAVDAVVSVSAPGRWFERGTRPMRIVHWLCETRTGRTVLRVARGTRLAHDSWVDVPAAPHEVVGAIHPTPLLIVHGDADHYFGMDHLELLRAGAPEAAIWVESEMGHAETATTPELTGRIADWLHAQLGTGRTVVGTSVPQEVCDDGPHD